MKRTQSALKTITGSLAQLERCELEELAQIVAALLDLQAPEIVFTSPMLNLKVSHEVSLFEEEFEPAQDEQKTAGKAKGHIEEKLINGYGPYLYLRYWQGKTLKSQYIGKAKGAQVT